MKVFTSSDHHFYHRNIIKYCERPFDFNDENCVIDNAKLMIERHNKIVSDDDFIILVGDLSASLRGREEHFTEILKMLKGKKILVRGNHDHQTDEFYKNAGFIAVFNDILIKEYYICHYPCFDEGQTRGKEIQYIQKVKANPQIKTIIHGHIHNKTPYEHDGIKRINVCVDYPPNDYYPQVLEYPEIIKYFTDNY